MDLRHEQFRLFSKLAHLYDAGVPLAEALDLVRRELSPAVRSAVAEVVNDLYRGSSFADALARHAGLFSAEIVGVIRAGEGRGELGSAARSVAGGLRGQVLDPVAASEEDIEALLLGAADASAIHIDPAGGLRLRRAGVLEAGGDANATALLAGLAKRARIEGGTGTGAFLWQDRLVRVAVAETPDGLAGVLRISGVPGEEPPEAAEWRAGTPCLLMLLGGNADASLRSILRGFDAARQKLVAVDLPVPEALSVDGIGAALSLDPDVICVANLARAEEGVELHESGVHAVAGVRSAALADEVEERCRKAARNRSGATRAPPLRGAVS